MIIGHLPAGYITSKLLYRRVEPRGVVSGLFVWMGLFGSVAPDLDMVYFHLIDHRQHHHHTYWTHFPILWVGLLLISATWFYTGRRGGAAVLLLVFSLNGFGHMLLDSIVGDILWFAPFGDSTFALFTVPAFYKPWWLNFLIHWSFVLEIAVVVWATVVWRRCQSSLLTRAIE